MNIKAWAEQFPDAQAIGVKRFGHQKPEVKWAGLFRAGGEDKKYGFEDEVRALQQGFGLWGWGAEGGVGSGGRADRPCTGNCSASMFIPCSPSGGDEPLGLAADLLAYIVGGVGVRVSDVDEVDATVVLGR